MRLPSDVQIARMGMVKFALLLLVQSIAYGLHRLRGHRWGRYESATLECDVCEVCGDTRNLVHKEAPPYTPPPPRPGRARVYRLPVVPEVTNGK